MSTMKRVFAGALGGLAGAALMGPLHKIISRAENIQPPQGQGDDATAKVADAVSETVTGSHLRKSEKNKAGQFVHYAFGAGVGALYGLLSDAVPSLRAGSGTVFGAAVYLGAHAATVPMLGLAPSPIENGLAQESVELASHLAYGLVTERVRRALA